MIIEAIRRFDIDFITIFNRALSPASQHFVTVKMGTSVLASQAEMDYELSKVDSLVVTRGILRQLQLESHLQESITECIMRLFTIRNGRICQSHKEVNEAHDNYQPRKSSIFLPPSAFQDLQENLKSRDEIIQLYFNIGGGQQQVNNVDSIIDKCYFIGKAHDSESVWILYLIDIELRTIRYVDARRSDTDVVSNALAEHLALMKPIFIDFLRVLIPEYLGDWLCGLLSPYYFSPMTNNDYDSGLYIAAVIYFICNGVPLFFTTATITRLRVNMAYWLLVEELPT